MESTDPTGRMAPARGGWPLAVTLLLVAILCYLVGSSFVNLRSGASGEVNQTARLALESLYESRMHYAFSSVGIRSGGGMRTSALIGKMRKLAAADGTGGYVRRLAVMQYVTADGDWRASLVGLRALPGAGDAASVERELAAWSEALGSAELDGRRAAFLTSWARSLHLGWYERPLLAVIYTKGGMTSQARDIKDASIRPLLWAVLLVAALLLALCVGVVLWSFAAWYGLVHRRFPSWLPRAVWPRARLTVTRDQSAVLYTMFVVYLAAFAAVRLVMPLLLRALRVDLHAISSEASAGISAAAMLLVIAAPLAMYRLLAPGQGLGWGHLGIRRGRVWAEALWGIAGYLMALPLLLGVSLLAARIFRGVDTPLNPIVLEVMSGGSPLLLALVLVQSAVMAPLMEELMFRGVFFGSLASRMAPWAAIVVSSSVFAILHPQLPLGFAAIFVLGAAFNCLYMLRGSLIAPMTAHALNNGTLVIAMVLVLRS